MATVSPAAFAVLFSVGTIAAIVRYIIQNTTEVSFCYSTFFLVGPIAQAKKFMDYKQTIEFVVRIVAAIAVILAIVLAILCGALVYFINGYNYYTLILESTDFSCSLCYYSNCSPYYVSKFFHVLGIIISLVMLLL